MWEWEMVLQYFAANPNVNQTLTSIGDFHKFSNDTNRAKFQDVFKLPFAGYRDYSNASLYRQGVFGQYWSSSPYLASSYSARSMRLESSSVNADYSNSRSGGNPVRCFKDHPDAPATRTITFNENG
jgi:hypothetical protein